VHGAVFEFISVDDFETDEMRAFKPSPRRGDAMPAARSSGDAG
jgi:hypothetical protein